MLLILQQPTAFYLDILLEGIVPSIIFKTCFSF